MIRKREKWEKTKLVAGATSSLKKALKRCSKTGKFLEETTLIDCSYGILANNAKSQQILEDKIKISWNRSKPIVDTIQILISIEKKRKVSPS